MAGNKKKPRKVVEKDGKFYTARGVELTRASHTKTEAEVSAMVLSALRRMTKFWKPKMDCINDGKRPYTGNNKLQKYEYHCEGCDKYVKQTEIHADHIINCGGISGVDWMDKIKPWLIKALVERTGYQRLCKTCHDAKTKKERTK